MRKTIIALCIYAIIAFPLAHAIEGPPTTIQDEVSDRVEDSQDTTLDKYRLVSDFNYLTDQDFSMIRVHGYFNNDWNLEKIELKVINGPPIKILKWCGEYVNSTLKWGELLTCEYAPNRTATVYVNGQPITASVVASQLLFEVEDIGVSLTIYSDTFGWEYRNIHATWAVTYHK